MEYSDYENTDLNLNINESYLMIKEDELLKERNKIINEAVDYLYQDKNDATIVLINYNWNIEKLKDQWYDSAD
jgi:replicative DNA helicase